MVGALIVAELVEDIHYLRRFAEAYGKAMSRPAKRGRKR